MTFPSQASNYAFIVFSFIGFVLISILLPMHIRVRNTGTCMYIVWTSIVCLFTAVNAVIWNRNYVNWSPVWCDISSRVIMAAGWGNEVALLCIVRRLYRIITMKAVKQSFHEVAIDFEILEDIGCFPAVILTAPAIPIFIMWPAVFGLVTAIYAGLTIYATIKQKAYRKEVLESHQALQFGHYWRLLALTGIGIICTLPYGILSLVANLVGGPLQPFNWDVFHAGFSEVSQTPASLWASDPLGEYGLEINRWSPVFNALMFFAFFGFTKDARADYRHAWFFIIHPLSFCSSDTDDKTSRKLSLPTHVARRKRTPHAPAQSETFVGSLRFVPYTESSQEMASTSQSSRSRPPSLPSSPSLSAMEPWSSQAHELNDHDGSFSVSESKGVLDMEQTWDAHVLTPGWHIDIRPRPPPNSSHWLGVL
ncbi:hypothetical protein SERLADRAFT_418224 [Serpula lacrymans var. lacrymans S7.9]|uniref:Uncharacterized protein n=1 Tax=Serpula lacrymans var. lacrymans (strain S7.9) TaxID=578457 RepID=F8PA00_SERL9|nr:uncharacterized protein SERLADRAFT_418224 [Serpula lacrymans var. lacrymans S7.9]EGO19998.1 hypothetical protein SERLADRAFT_418224 [Serpula lacrymans var. lacrymans S7.9]